MLTLLYALLWTTAPEPMTVSWYGEPFHGRTTASGAVYDMDEMTCASPALPFGAVLLLERGGRYVAVTVTDRGPYAVDAAGRAEWPLRPHPTRGLDLSRGAMKRLHGLDEGIVEVRTWRVR